MGEGDMQHIGEVAETVGLSLRTIRHYEEVGVVVPSGRTSGGFRLYTAEDIDRLLLVKRMKPLDFSLDEIRDVIQLIDQLSDDAIEPTERNAVVERLAMYVSLMNERRDRLREQFALASEFVDVLTLRLQGYRGISPLASDPSHDMPT